MLGKVQVAWDVVTSKNNTVFVLPLQTSQRGYTYMEGSTVRMVMREEHECYGDKEGGFPSVLKAGIGIISGDDA